MIEISDTQISLNGFPVADITWKPNACATERDHVVGGMANEDAYENGFRDGKDESENEAVDCRHEFAIDELNDLWQQIMEVDIDMNPDQIHEETATAVFDAVLNLINAQKERLSQ